MSTAMVPHHTRASHSDLMALARLWEWERTVELELPRVIAETDIRIVFQPIFRLVAGTPVARGFEALSRFPIAPSIPLGLWFRTAQEMGLSRQLELTALGAAVESMQGVSEKAFLCVNASVDTVGDLVELVPSIWRDRLIVDVHYSALVHPLDGEALQLLRERGGRFAIDDIPLGDAHLLRPLLLDLRPDFIKVDVVTGLFDNPMSRLELGECVAWCRDAGIGVIAERVERLDDLGILDKVGVDWVQGYCLSPPFAF